MSTAIYLRVSSPKGQKTDSQRAELESWLKRHRYRAVQWFEDHESGTGIHLRRDNLSSIAYSEELISSTISATLQSTDRHHGIVGQKYSHFQLDS